MNPAMVSNMSMSLNNKPVDELSLPAPGPHSGLSGLDRLTPPLMRQLNDLTNKRTVDMMKQASPNQQLSYSTYTNTAAPSPYHMHVTHTNAPTNGTNSKECRKKNSNRIHDPFFSHPLHP